MNNKLQNTYQIVKVLETYIFEHRAYLNKKNKVQSQ